MRRQKYSKVAEKLRPYLGQVAAAVTTGTTGTDGPHVHNLSDLGGELSPLQAPWVTAALNALKPHNIADPAFHSVVGPQNSVVGLVAANTIGLLSSTNDAATNPSTLLRGGAAGEVTTGALTVKAGGILPQVSVGESVVTVHPQTRMETDNYTSQLTGWRHTYGGELDTRYIFANEMKIIKFIADLQQALAGSQIVSKSVSTLAAAFSAPRPGGSAGLIVDDLPSAQGMPVFENGDMILITEDSRANGGFSSTRCWGTVSGYTNLGNKKQDWTFTRCGEFGLSVPTWTGAPKTASSTNASLTVAKVDNTALDNLSLACVLVESTTVTTTAPAGWVQIGTATVTGMRATIYRKTAGAAEPSTYTWSHSTSVDSMVILYNFSLQDPTAPISSYTVNVHETATQFPVIKSLTPVSDSDYYVGFVAARANRNPIIQPDGWVADASFTAGGNTLAAMHTGTDGYAGDPFGDVSASLTGGTARAITFTVNIIPKPITLDLETGFMPIGNVVEPGAFVLDYGKSGDGWHEITAIDGQYGSNSPYSRVVNWVGHPATGATVRTQDGNLKGIFGEGNEFGFFAGNGKTPAHQYLRISNLGAKLNNIALQLFSGGVQKVNIDPAGVDVWFGTGPTDRRLTWNGFTLGIKGAVTIDEPSGFADGGYLAAGGGAVRLDNGGVSVFAHATNVRTNYQSTRGVNLRDGTGNLIGQLTGYSFSGINGVDLYARSYGQAQAVMGAEQIDIIFGGGSAGAPRVEAIIDATNNLLRMYSAGKIQMYNSGSATPDFQLSGGAAIFSVNVAAPWLNLGDITKNYTPTAPNWNGPIGTTLLLNGLDYTTIGFHDSGSRVDFIRVGGGVITLGYDGGFGVASVKVGGNLATGSGPWWYLGGYSVGAPSATGYLTVVVNGTTYRIAAQAV